MYNDKSILDDYSENELEHFFDTLMGTNKFAVKNKWQNLFGNF